MAQTRREEDHNWCITRLANLLLLLPCRWLAAALKGGGAALLSPPNSAREMHIFVRVICVKGPVSALFSDLIQRLHMHPSESIVVSFCLQPPTGFCYQLKLTLHFSFYEFSNCTKTNNCMKPHFFHVDNVASSFPLILFLHSGSGGDTMLWFFSLPCTRLSKLFFTFDKTLQVNKNNLCLT